MWFRFGVPPSRGVMGAASFELGAQVHPLAFELAGGNHEERLGIAPVHDLAPVKSVAARRCLGGDAGEVGADMPQGILRLAKADELRVVGISAGRAGQYRLGEQRLAPAGDKTLPVEEPRMYGPDPHERHPS